METETKPLWTTTRQAMGKTWTIALYPNDAALGENGSGSPHVATTRIREQKLALKASLIMDAREETLLHELIETCFVELGMKYEHDDINRLSFGLFGFLRGFGLWQEFPWPDREQK